MRDLLMNTKARDVIVDFLLVWWGWGWGSSAKWSWSWWGWAWGTIICCWYSLQWWQTIKIWAGWIWGTKWAGNNWWDSCLWSIVAYWWWGGGTAAWCDWWSGGWWWAYTSACAGWSGCTWQWYSWWCSTAWTCTSWWGWGGAWQAWVDASGSWMKPYPWKWWDWIQTDISWDCCWYAWWGWGGTNCQNACRCWYGWCWWGWEWGRGTCQLLWCDATYYWWWGGGSWSCSCKWWDWYQWVAIIRYPAKCQYKLKWWCEYVCNWYYIHCFTSDWFLINKRQMDQVPWIYHNAWLWLISMSWDWNTWITIADKNLWATEYWTEWQTEVAGCNYMWCFYCKWDWTLDTWYHKPSKEEFEDIINLWHAICAWDKNNGGLCVKKYLKMPWYWYETGGNYCQTTTAQYWTSTIFDSAYRCYLNIDNAWCLQFTCARYDCRYYRPFKDDPVAPDNTWDILYQN